MAVHRSPRWEPVETFGTVGHEHGPLLVVDTALGEAGLDGHRFRSDAGECAILLPAGQLTEAGTPVSVTNLSPGVTHLLFVDPMDVHSVTSLLALIGQPKRSVRLSVSGTAAPAGLTADVGSVVVGPGRGRSVTFRLYRVGGGTVASIAPGPRVGESADVTRERSKWFDTRHGGPDG
jgi:hypothetical protein